MWICSHVNWLNSTRTWGISFASNSSPHSRKTAPGKTVYVKSFVGWIYLGIQRPQIPYSNQFLPYIYIYIYEGYSIQNHIIIYIYISTLQIILCWKNSYKALKKNGQRSLLRKGHLKQHKKKSNLTRWSDQTMLPRGCMMPITADVKIAKLMYLQLLWLRWNRWWKLLWLRWSKWNDSIPHLLLDVKMFIHRCTGCAFKGLLVSWCFGKKVARWLWKYKTRFKKCGTSARCYMNPWTSNLTGMSEKSPPTFFYVLGYARSLECIAIADHSSIWMTE